MEQCFRTAVWIFVLIGSLQASVIPTLRFDLDALGFELMEEVKCETNVTFITPKNVLPDCHATALKEFMKGLDQAEKDCTDENDRLAGLWDSITDMFPEELNSNKPTQCSWDVKDHGQQYDGFIQTLKTFLVKLNTKKL